MCLVLFAYRVIDGYPLIVAANRDEFYARPALAAHRWQDAPHVFAGRDLTANGTWLGVSTHRRFAAVTNFSEVGATEPLPAPRSRGDLTAAFLTGEMPALAFANAIDGERYQGFSLLLWDGDALVYSSNRNDGAILLEPGIHGLANTHLDGTWPKAMRGKRGLGAALEQERKVDALLRLLADESVPPDDDLPHRGRDIAFERRVAPIFIRGEEYGTRASTVVTFGAQTVDFTEQSFTANGALSNRIDITLPLGDHP